MLVFNVTFSLQSEQTCGRLQISKLQQLHSFTVFVLYYVVYSVNIGPAEF